MRQGEANLFDQSGDLKLLGVGANSGDQLRRFPVSILEAQLDVLEAAVPELPELLLIEQGSPCDQVCVEVARPGMADQLRKVLSHHWLAS